MLTAICQYLRNWFDRKSDGTRLPSWTEEITISNGELVGFSDRLLPGQYFRILDSVLNNGVWQYGSSYLKDETFTGTVQSMAVPDAVVEAAIALEKFRAKYGEVIDSPFASENYFGYSWSKAGGGGAGSSAAANSMPTTIVATLDPWRKI